MRNEINRSERVAASTNGTKKSRFAALSATLLATVATAAAPTAIWAASGDSGVGERTGAAFVRPAFAVEKSTASGKIVQTAAQTPISTDSDARIGVPARRNGAPGRAGKMAAELENLPQMNVRPDDPSQPEHQPHGAELFDVLPGATRFSELKKNPILSNPVAEESVDGYAVATYQVPTLPDTTIQIVGKNDVVEAIMINLNEPRSEADARKVFEAEIKDVRPIIVPDEIGNFREVFPEKGVAFVLEPGETPGVPSNRVVQLVAETVKSEYFILRAEQALQTSLTNARDDAEHALLHDANAPGAHWILAQTHLAVGDYPTARRHIFKAIKLNDSLAQFHLTLVDALIRSGEIDAASRYVEAVRDAFSSHPLYVVEAACLEAELRREGKEPDYDGAISLGQSALRAIGELEKANPTPDVALAAKRLALRANLGIALAVARKSWKNPRDQEKALEWLAAADDIAKEIDETRGDESGLASARLDVFETAANVGLELPDAQEIDEYVQAARVETDAFLKKTLDEVSAASARWKTGNALATATRIFEARQDYKQAVVYGLKALEYLEIAMKFRPEIDRVPIGLTQARLGVDFMNGLKNAKEASAYFEKANEYFKAIEKDLRPRDAAEVGARLAAIGTAYWKSGQKEKGVDAMKRGVALLQLAVKDGVVEKAELYVPYANLSTMCKGLDMTAEAAKYAKLAASVAPKK